MSDLKLIKEELLMDTSKLELLLQKVGCEYITYEHQRITAQLPPHFESNNKRACQIKLNDSLTCSIRNKNDFSGDIFGLISYIHHRKKVDEFVKDIPNAKEFICKTVGLEKYLNNHTYVKKDTDLDWLFGIKKERRKEIEIKDNPILPETILDEFVSYPYYGWIEEGISYETQKLYGIGFDLESKRITIPMRNRVGQLVGVKGRIMKDEDDERKYLYLYRYQNRYEWFNFHYAHPYILMDNRVYIYEAEKSCMKAYSNGIFNTLAIGSSEISPEQALIIKQLGTDIEIVLCYDKGIDIEDIRKQAELFVDRKVFAMFDTDNLLGYKDSPIDCGIDIWNQLVEKNIYKIDIKRKKQG